MILFFLGLALGVWLGASMNTPPGLLCPWMSPGPRRYCDVCGLTHEQPPLLED